MKRYDFLIIYQIKARELENLLLLKNELERRGYSVRIENLYRFTQRTKRYDADVVIGQADDDWSLSVFRYFVKDPKKVISFKWEQIYSNNGCNRTDTVMAIRGKAREAVTFAWGDVSLNRFVNIYGVPEKNIRKTGHITMDFLRPEFKPYFKSREEICKEFGLDPNKKVYLYISSFAALSLSKEELESYRNNHTGNDPRESQKLCVDSQKQTIEWFFKGLELHPNIQLIYRPHPVEKNNELLKECCKKNKNFRVISDYSIKQWILTCDKLYTWFSTSIGEVYAAGKPCSVVRPVEIPFGRDVEIYKNAKIISEFEEFDREFEFDGSFETDFPIPHGDMDSYYYISKNAYTFELQADVCEEVLKDNTYIIKDYPMIHNLNTDIGFRVKCVLRRYFGASRLCSALSKSVFKGTKFADTVRLNREDYDLVRINVPTKRELKRIEKNINLMLESRVTRT